MPQDKYIFARKPDGNIVKKKITPGQPPPALPQGWTRVGPGGGAGGGFDDKVSGVPDPVGRASAFYHGLNPFSGPMYPEQESKMADIVAQNSPAGRGAAFGARMFNAPDIAVSEALGRRDESVYNIAGQMGTMGLADILRGVVKAAKSAEVAKSALPEVKATADAAKESKTIAKTAGKGASQAMDMMKGAPMKAAETHAGLTQALDKQYEQLKDVVGLQYIKTGKVQQIAKMMANSNDAKVAKLGEYFLNQVKQSGGHTPLITYNTAHEMDKALDAMRKSPDALTRLHANRMHEELLGQMQGIEKASGVADKGDAIRAGYKAMQDLKTYSALKMKPADNVVKRVARMIPKVEKTMAPPAMKAPAQSAAAEKQIAQGLPKWPQMNYDTQAWQQAERELGPGHPNLGSRSIEIKKQLEAAAAQAGGKTGYAPSAAATKAAGPKAPINPMPVAAGAGRAVTTTVGDPGQQ